MVHAVIHIGGGDLRQGQPDLLLLIPAVKNLAAKLCIFPGKERLQKASFVSKIIIEGRLGHAGHLCDLLHANSVISSGMEKLQRAVQDFFSVVHSSLLLSQLYRPVYKMSTRKTLYFTADFSFFRPKTLFFSTIPLYTSWYIKE